MARLIVCGGCRRHVHETEARCPFCDVEVRATPGVVVPPHVSRATQYAMGVAILGAAASASCKDGATTKSPVDDAAAAGDATAAHQAEGDRDAAVTATAVGTDRTTIVATSTAVATVTATATGRPSGGPFACGGETCGPSQVCLHPCTPCGGQSARMGRCPPQAPPQCSTSVPSGARLQGRDAYAFCPPMPYGCVFPDACADVSV